MEHLVVFVNAAATDVNLIIGKHLLN